MVGFLQQAARGAGGFFDRISQLPNNPAFAAGIGFLQGNPQAGIAQANAIRQSIAEQEQQKLAQMAAAQKAQADAAQREMQNDFERQRIAISQQNANKAPSAVQEYLWRTGGDQAAARKLAEQEAAAKLKKLEAGNNGITVLPDGTVQIGGPAGAGLGVKGRNDLDTRRINTADQMQRINQINALYDDRFLKSGERFNNLILTIKDKGLLPGNLSPEESKDVGEFAQFRQTAFNNLNQTLREMSGAAITPQESERLTKALPNPGKGVFDGDSPTQFKSKLDTVTTQLRLAVARYNFAAATGQTDAATSIVSLEGMRDFINKQGDSIEQQLRAANPQASDAEINATVAAQLRSLFGEF